MDSIHRRLFMQSAAAGTLIASNGFSANETITLGLMGVGGRGSWLARAMARQPNVRVAWICDVDRRKAERSQAQVGEIQGAMPKITQNFRELLDDPSVDAVVNATPDHWHAAGTIFACQAGKHVYVEKPASHCLWEGRKMVEAARKYNRVVQLGTQTRSAPYAQHGVELIQSGAIGDVHLVKIFNMKTRGELNIEPDQETPPELDYDAWLGPAPKRAYNPNHYLGGRWNWKWPYSGGDIINDGVHQIDLGRWCSMRRAPNAVFASGHTYELKDGQGTPDTQHATYEFDGLTLMIEVALWTPYMKKTPPDIRESDVFPDFRFNATRVEVYGAEGMMYFGRHGGGWQLHDENGLRLFEYGRDPIDDHIVNFFDCVRNGGRPNADIEEGHLSTALCHLANISHRVGNRKLDYDAEHERFINDDEANALLKREYREPWAIPEEI